MEGYGGYSGNVQETALKSGVYGYYTGNGAKMAARPAAAGDVIMVAGGWYVESLAAGGLVELTGKEAEQAAPAPEVEAMAKPAAKRRR